MEEGEQSKREHVSAEHGGMSIRVQNEIGCLVEKLILDKSLE